MRKIDTDILVLGAGLSGLVAADTLCRKNLRVTVLEKEPEVGGLARTFDFCGFRFDIGGHKICFNGQRNQDYLKGILNGEELLSMKQKSRILFDGKYIVYPVNFLSILDVKKKDLARIIFEALRRDRSLKADNFENWIKLNYGPTLYRIFFKDYTEKVWGRSCSDLASVWAGKRVGSNSIFKFLKEVFIPDSTVKERTRNFFFPREGIGAFSKALEARLNGSRQIYKNVSLGRFSAEEGKLSALSFAAGNEKLEVSFKQVFSSIPIRELLETAERSFPLELNGIKEMIKYRSLILVSLIVAEGSATDWHWCYIPSKEFSFSRLYEPKFWSYDMAPFKDKTLLCAEVFCDYGDPRWQMSDYTIAGIVEKDLVAAGILRGDTAVLGTCVKRVRYAYPLLYYGYEGALDKAKGLLSGLKNIRLIGRSGSHAYYDMEECISDTVGAVESVYG
ncbi:MAG: FAD-binding protein [Candidatus Omnitrophica bacterium]|nr:FAD-binding protein [Candidatus Omnitrophota bacterium]